MATLPPIDPPIRWKRKHASSVRLIAALSLLCYLSPSSSLPSLARFSLVASASSAAASSPIIRSRKWSLPSVKLTAINNSRRCQRSPSANDVIVDCDFSCEKSYALDESDFEGDEYSDYDDGSDDESILWSSAAENAYSFRGGGAAMGGRAASRFNLPGIHSGWRKPRNRGNNSMRQRQQSKQQQIQRQIQDIQQQKLRQFRQNFRRKQRQFQESLYALNSRLNYNFPKPPYQLWQLDSEPSIGKTTLTGKIFMLNIAVFGLQTMFPQITALGAKRSDMIMEGRQLYRLVTPIFLHGGIGHLMANSYSLKSMGLNVEKAFGQPRLIATYLVSGVMGNIFSAIQSPNPAVGASGAIFGLVGAYYTFLSRNQDLFGYTGQMQKSALIETIGFNLVLGTMNPMIDNWGHIGGFVGGVGMAYLIGPKLYLARVPIGQDNMGAGGFGVGKIVIDRPNIMFRTPDAVEEGFDWVNDNMRRLGSRVTSSVAGLFNSGGTEYFLDKNVDYAMGSSTIRNNGDGTIYRTLKDDIQLEGNVNVTPSDGFRQDVTELDPVTVRQREIQRRRRSAPKAGYSIRPRYGHLYR